MADLLEALHLTGSLKLARQRLNISYMYAWSMVQTVNRCFNEPLVVTKRGGTRGGGGTSLTNAGREALTLYRQMERKAINANVSDWKKFQKLLKRQSANVK